MRVKRINIERRGVIVATGLYGGFLASYTTWTLVAPGEPWTAYTIGLVVAGYIVAAVLLVSCVAGAVLRTHRRGK